MTFQAFKLTIVDFTQLPKDALHIYVGMAVFLLTLALLFHTRLRPRRFFLAWLAAVLMAAAGEVLDLTTSYRNSGRWLWDYSIHDVINTCLLPTALYLLSFTSILRR